jgi:hypothetical protein
MHCGKCESLFAIEIGLMYLLELSVNILSNVLQCIMQEKEAKNIEIPNIKWDVFELMMRYFGSVPFI